MTDEMTPELIESLAAGYNAILESQHTARAIQVNRLVADISAQLQKWIDDEIYSRLDRYDAVEIANPQRIDLTQGIMVALYFGNLYKNPKSNKYVRGLGGGAAFGYPPKESGYPPILHLSTDRYLGEIIDEHPNNLPDRLNMDNIAACRMRFLQEDRDSDSIRIRRRDAQILRYMFGTSNFIHSLRHETTHYVQWLNDELGDSAEYFRKAGLPRASINGKYHDVLPWEIDAGIHGNLIEIIEGADKRSITEMAMHYMKYVFEPLKGTRYKKIPSLEKQCWDTAISLCRAIKMAKAQHPEATPEEIIKYLDDYAV